MTKSLDIQSQIRDRKYYDQFSYSAKFRMQEICCLRRSLDKEDICSALDRRQNNRNVNFAGSWAWNDSQRTPITQTTVDNCLLFADYLKSIQSEYKFTVYDADIAFLHTDDIVELRRLIGLDFVQVVQIKQAQVDLPRGSILIKNSNYKFRTYFGNQKLSSTEKTHLKNFIYNTKELRPSPLLDEMLQKSTFSYLYDSFFIDHNDSGILTLLQLVVPVKLKKTASIITDK